MNNILEVIRREISGKYTDDRDGGSSPITDLATEWEELGPNFPPEKQDEILFECSDILESSLKGYYEESGKVLDTLIFLIQYLPVEWTTRDSALLFRENLHQRINSSTSTDLVVLFLVGFTAVGGFLKEEEILNLTAVKKEHPVEWLDVYARSVVGRELSTVEKYAKILLSKMDKNQIDFFIFGLRDWETLWKKEGRDFFPFLISLEGVSSSLDKKIAEIQNTPWVSAT